MDKEIERLYVDQLGYIYSSGGEIETFLVNGEMASITWYRQGNREINGKFVIEVLYSDQPKRKQGGVGCTGE